MRFGKKLKPLLLLSSALMILQWSAITVAQTDRKTLVIPIAVYILDSAGVNDGLSSQRTAADLVDHFKQVNTIWGQADIAIEPVAFERLNVPQDLLWSIVHRTGRGGIRDFYRGMNRGEVAFSATEHNAPVWAFYVRTMGGVNGLAPLGAKTFFVADNPTVDDARVTSHEIGHVLGLYHARADSRKLLFSGANGVFLTREEQRVARYNAKRILR